MQEELCPAIVETQPFCSEMSKQAFPEVTKFSNIPNIGIIATNGCHLSISEAIFPIQRNFGGCFPNFAWSP
jgi:hypothetical protein